MTVEELKKITGYEFECNISKEMTEEWCDVWGGAFVRFGKNQSRGAEYNLCFDLEEGSDDSAIYKMSKDFLDDVSADYDTFNHYEINFNDSEWKNKLEEAMCKSVIEFFFEPHTEKDEALKNQYKFQDEFWSDDDTYCLVLKNKKTNEEYLIEYQKDEDRFVYEYDAEFNEEERAYFERCIFSRIYKDL